jgi:choline-sulfatase
MKTPHTIKQARSQNIHVALVAVVVAAVGTAMPAQGEEARRPNIIYIFTDQQSASMMSCTGNPWLKTPAVDYLADNGTRFERAYTTNPKCVPARVGMITGRFPGEFGVRRSDSFRDVDGRTGYAQNNIGAQLKRAGYDLAYGGKVHLPEELDPETLGFEVISTDRKMELAEDCAAYITRSHSKPYYLVASFINPHDICYYYRRDLKPNKTILELLKAVGDDPTSSVNTQSEKAIRLIVG